MGETKKKEERNTTKHRKSTHLLSSLYSFPAKLSFKKINKKNAVKMMCTPAERRYRLREGAEKEEGLINVLAMINGLRVAITNWLGFLITGLSR